MTPSRAHPLQEGGSGTLADGVAVGPADLDALLRRLRPKLHRYCARMTGSAIDGEDVVQDALAKAFEALPTAGPISSPEAWLFRIAHNAALDFLRRRARLEAGRSDEDPDMVADPESPIINREAAAASLRTFMRLSVSERSTVILTDVLGHSQREVGAVLDASIPSVKASLHRGRSRLRVLAQEPDDRPIPTMSDRERSLLSAYVDRFNARDFEAIRDMLAAEVRLDLVAKTKLTGRSEVGTYIGNYSRTYDWHFVAGFVDGRPAAIACEPGTSPGQPMYFVIVDWREGEILGIRDFRYARYVCDSAELTMLDPSR